MWFATHCVVHGDLTTGNLIVNGNYLFIIDFEPGPTRYVDRNTEDGRQAIITDLNDFVKSVQDMNKERVSNFMATSDNATLEARKNEILARLYQGGYRTRKRHSKRSKRKHSKRNRN
jgi:tRNA A-37 threonylcarbamoyl transferase component Bud32